MALKSYNSKITVLKWSSVFQLFLIIGFLGASVSQLGGAMGGQNNDYLKALLFDGLQAVLSMNITAASTAGRPLGLRRGAFWTLVVLSITFNLYYKWSLIDPTPGFRWDDLDKVSAADLYIQIFSNVFLGLGIVILTETRTDTNKDVAFYSSEENRLEMGRIRRKEKREKALLLAREKGHSELVGSVDDLSHDRGISS